jgi:hypothetical protein
MHPLGRPENPLARHLLKSETRYAVSINSVKMIIKTHQILRMNTPITVFARMAAAGALVFLAHDARSQLLVGTGNLYQNAAPNFQNANFNNGNGQEGNQIILAGTAASDLITSFSFQFDYTGSLASPDASADVRFYANDGTPYNGYASPGTVLFDSGTFSIGGYTTGSTENWFSPADFTGTGAGLDPGVGVVVPQDFTWTVTFSGLQAGENAGLAVYYPPTVGSDALPNGDAWIDPSSGLEAANDSGNPLEFGAVFNGIPEVTTPDSSCLPISVVSVLAGFGWVKRLSRRG